MMMSVHYQEEKITPEKGFGKVKIPCFFNTNAYDTMARFLQSSSPYFGKRKKEIIIRVFVVSSLFHQDYG